MAEAGALLDALRERGADRFDPVGFGFLEALARRSATQRGGVRRLLDARLAGALQEFRARFEGASAAGLASDDIVAPLAGLLAYIRERSPDTPAGAPAELKSVARFRKTWSRLSVDRQLAEAVAQAPEHAGPLNSERLVLQALKAMRDIAPDYLQHFMSYADALLWLDQIDAGSRAVPKGAVRGERDKKRKPARGKG